MSTIILVDHEGIEPNRQPPNILRQRIYSPPLGTQSKICNTLRYAFRQRRELNEECVLKCTTHWLLPFDCSAIHFNTLVFLVPQEGFHPLGRPFTCLLECVAGTSFPIHTYC